MSMKDTISQWWRSWQVARQKADEKRWQEWESLKATYIIFFVNRVRQYYPGSGTKAYATNLRTNENSAIWIKQQKLSAGQFLCVSSIFPGDRSNSHHGEHFLHVAGDVIRGGKKLRAGWRRHERRLIYRFSKPHLSEDSQSF